MKEVAGRIAIERGPIVYCAEWPDVEGGSALGLLFDGRARSSAETDKNSSAASP